MEDAGAHSADIAPTEKRRARPARAFGPRPRCAGPLVASAGEATCQNSSLNMFAFHGRKKMERASSLMKLVNIKVRYSKKLLYVIIIIEC